MNKIKINKASTDFTVLPNDMLKNPKMSMKAKGLLSYLLSLPNDWKIYKSELSCHFSDGKDALVSAFNELIELGYIQQEELPKEAGKFTGFDYTVADYPLRENRGGKTVAENPPLLSTNKQRTNKQNSINIPFDEFWDLYGKKKGDKERAKKLWDKLHNDVRKKIIDSLPDFKLSVSSYQYLPFPETYLHQKRWHDELEATVVSISNSKLPKALANNSWK